MTATVKNMEFLVEFEVKIPDETPDSKVQHRERAEATAAAELVDEGHLVRVWKWRVATSESTIIGLYRADSEAQLDGLLAALPLYEWMGITVTPLEPHPNDPALAVTRQEQAMSSPLPDPRLTQVYRLEATLAQPRTSPPPVPRRGRRAIRLLTLRSAGTVSARSAPRTGHCRGVAAHGCQVAVHRLPRGAAAGPARREAEDDLDRISVGVRREQVGNHEVAHAGGPASFHHNGATSARGLGA
jgi:muconolactone D-isomerase